MTEEQNEKLKRAEAEREEYLNGWKRAKADLINFKTDEARRLAEAIRRGSEVWANELIPVLESCRLGLKAGSGAGLEEICKQLESALKRCGIEEIKAKLGESFDPARHESIGERQSEFPPGTIAEVVGNGYLLGEKVIRAVRVMISKQD